MSNGESGKGFFGNLFKKVTGAPPEQPPAAPNRQAGNLPPQQGARGNTGPMKPPAGRPPQNQSSTFVRSTGPLSTGQLSTSNTAPLTAPVVELTPEQKAEESQKRLAFIMAYLKDPNTVPAFKDPKYVYKIVSDERSYQSELSGGLEAKLKLFLSEAEPYFLMEEDEEIPAFQPGPNGELPPQVQVVLDRLEAKREFRARREEIEAELQKSRDVQTKLFLILKQITGVKGKTGGTGFLTPPPGL